MITNSFDDTAISVYIINLKNRTDRLEHAFQQFHGRNEFEVHVIEAIRHEIGAVGLWQSFRSCISTAIENDDDVIIICEDDHQFTSAYNKHYLFKNILDASEQSCDLLLGGIGKFNHAVPITANRYWIDFFWSTQFVIVYKKLFKNILKKPFDITVTSDGLLSELTSHKMVLYPFISVQRDFGYSDVTQLNNDVKGLIPSYFESCEKTLEKYRKVYDTYLKL